ncbi:MAG: hypothetical protein ACJAR0_002164 [Candidatus Azotimanducaceae bacterium]
MFRISLDPNSADYLVANRISNGKIYRLDPLSPNIQAEEFAQGPPSSNNDGARGALAPVVVSETAKADFGDAPDSCAKSLGENGPRHGNANLGLFLGQTADRETQAYLSPESDDQVDVPDEDGINLVTAVEAGNATIIRVEVQGEGFLNGWIDFNRNSRFDSTEQVVTDASLSAGFHNLILAVCWRLRHERPCPALQNSDCNTWHRYA